MKAYEFEMQKFADRKTLDYALATKISKILQDAVKKSGQSTLVVSGGSTPLGFFKNLSCTEISWNKVKVALADERWVDVSDSSSNERLVKENLLQNNAAMAQFVGFYTGEKRAVDAEKECEKKLAFLPQPFDAVVLGMGNDGHTASLFPGSVNLEKATNMTSGRQCLAMMSASAPHERMTMTLPALLNSKNIFLHIAGKEKLKVFEKALCENDPLDMPIGFILSAGGHNVQVYWAP